jgi:hypothetical protein
MPTVLIPRMPAAVCWFIMNSAVSYCSVSYCDDDSVGASSTRRAENVEYTQLSSGSESPQQSGTLTAWADASPVFEQTYYSIGGGFIRRDGDQTRVGSTLQHPYPYPTSAELIRLCDEHGMTIDAIARANEESLHGREAIDAGLDAIWTAMAASVTEGLAGDGQLPGA